MKRMIGAAAVSLAFLAVVCAYSQSGTSDSRTQVVSFRLRPTVRIQKGLTPWRGSFTPDGQLAIVEGYLFETRTGRILRRFRPARADVFAISPDGKFVAIPDHGYRGPRNLEEWSGVALFEMASGKHVHTFGSIGHTGGKPTFAADGKTLFAISYDRLYAWDVASRKLVRDLRTRPGGARHVAISPDGKSFAVVSGYFPPSKHAEEADLKRDRGEMHHQIGLWSVGTGKKEKSFPPAKGSVLALGFTPDGKYVVTDAKPVPAIWEVSTARRVKVAPGGFPGQCFIPVQTVQGRYLLLIDDKHTKNAFLDLRTGRTIQIQTETPGNSVIIAISPDGSKAIIRRYIVGGDPASSLLMGELEPESIHASQARD